MLRVPREFLVCNSAIGISSFLFVILLLVLCCLVQGQPRWPLRRINLPAEKNIKRLDSRRLRRARGRNWVRRLDVCVWRREYLRRGRAHGCSDDHNQRDQDVVPHMHAVHVATEYP